MRRFVFALSDEDAAKLDEWRKSHEVLALTKHPPRHEGIPLDEIYEVDRITVAVR